MEQFTQSAVLPGQNIVKVGANTPIFPTDFRQTKTKQRTAFAFLCGYRCRCALRVKKLMQSFRGIPGFRSQGFVKYDILTTALATVKKIAIPDFHIQHLLKAHGLRTYLHFVAIVRLGFAAFIFHGFHLGDTPGFFFGIVKFHHICFSDQAQLQRANGQRVFNFHSAPGCTRPSTVRRFSAHVCSI